MAHIILHGQALSYTRRVDHTIIHIHIPVQQNEAFSVPVSRSGTRYISKNGSSIWVAGPYLK